MQTGDHAAVALGLRQHNDLVVFAGNTVDRTIATALRVTDGVSGSYVLRTYNSLRGAWVDEGRISADALASGIPVQLERKGFWMAELRQQT